MAKKTAKPATKTKESVVISMLLDESGSMAPLQASTISGFNEYVDTLRKSMAGQEVRYVGASATDPTKRGNPTFPAPGTVARESTYE